MNICHVITRMIVGGAQENTLLSCQGLAERGHQVTLMTGPETGPEGSLLEEAAADERLTMQVLPNLRRAVNPIRDGRALDDLTRRFQLLRPDIVHTHSSKAGVLGRIAACRANVPRIVHTIHGMSFNRTQWPWTRFGYRMLERYCSRFTDRIVCVADAMVDQAVAAGLGPRERFTTIYSGMRTDWFMPGQYDRPAIRQQWGVDDTHVVVGVIARLFRHKGYEQLIPAMAAAVARCDRLRFVWIGDGAQRAEYESQLQRLGIRPRVHLTGLISPRAVAEQIAGLDMLVHASQWEGLPRAAVQALLMECPVISFAIDGAPEVVVPDRTGLLVPLNNVPALADAMIQLADRPDRRREMGAAGRALCLERFDQRTMVEALEQLYRQLDPTRVGGDS